MSVEFTITPSRDQFFKSLLFDRHAVTSGAQQQELARPAAVGSRVRYWAPVPVLIAVTLAPGTTDPVVSVTVTSMAPVVPWPKAVDTAAISRKENCVRRDENIHVCIVNLS